ncbi:hypothetical protein SB778_28635, partial [Paraburkholderia sp. SIMBA_050]
FQKCKPSIRRNASERINDGYFNGLLEVGSGHAGCLDAESSGRRTMAAHGLATDVHYTYD